MHPTIEIIEVGLLDLKIVDNPSSDQTWGFLIQPNFKEEGVNLQIRFELIFPITRLFVMQKYKNFNYVQMKYFDNKYFVDELNRQIKELNI